MFVKGVIGPNESWPLMTFWEKEKQGLGGGWGPTYHIYEPNAYKKYGTFGGKVGQAIETCVSAIFRM